MFHHLLLRHVYSFGLLKFVMFRHVLFSGMFNHLLLRHVYSFGLCNFHAHFRPGTCLLLRGRCVSGCTTGRAGLLLSSAEQRWRGNSVKLWHVYSFGLFKFVMFRPVLFSGMFINHLLLRHVSSFGLFTCVMFFNHLLLPHVSSFGLFTCVIPRHVLFSGVFNYLLLRLEQRWAALTWKQRQAFACLFFRLV